MFVAICMISCTGKTHKTNSASDHSASKSTTQLHRARKKVDQLDKNIRSIFQDSKGHYWIGTNSSGVYRYDNKKLTHYTIKDGLADNQILSIQEDVSGNIWFGTGGFGLCKFDGKEFKTLTHTVKFTDGKASNWNSTPSDLWFCAGGGVLRYRNSSLDYLPFETMRSKSSSHSPFSLSRFGVYCILKDKQGNCWFGTQAEGVCKYDGKTLSWLTEKGLAGPAVLAIFEDRKGNVWFGNNGGGLFRYDGKSLTNITEEKGLNNVDFRVSGKPGLGTLARVYAINEDNSGNIWIGTVDAGVWRYDGNNLTNYTTKDGLPSNAVNTIYKDKKGELWFGTDSDGLCKFNGRTFTPFTFE